MEKSAELDPGILETDSNSWNSNKSRTASLSHS